MDPRPMALLEIKDLRLDFVQGTNALRALDDVSLRVAPGEALCLVGESGSGKSVTALSITRLLATPPARFVGGEIFLEGRDVLKMSPAELRRVRGGVVSYVFQEPGTSLNPVLRVGSQIRESLKLHCPEAATNAEVVRLMGLVGIPEAETRSRSYPHELSGGTQQRVMIAMALASRPKLLVADEPTTALDVTIQAQIIELLRDLKHEAGMAILLITHNLGLVGELADRVAVLYAGQVVEEAPARALLSQPLHPYTRGLLQSVPKLGAGTKRLKGITGTVPQLGSLPAGCRFHPRCPIALPQCSANPPEIIEAQPDHWVRCPWWQASLETGSRQAEVVA